MDKQVSTLINEQINKEFYSAYLYLEIANYYDCRGLDGYANWFIVQAKEEEEHAMLFYRYLHDNNEPVTLDEIAKPVCAFTDLMEPLKAALEHEKYVTGLIHTIYSAAAAAGDYRSMKFLDDFIREQGEEEKNASEQITKMELFGDDARSLYLLNRELKERK